VPQKIFFSSNTRPKTTSKEGSSGIAKNFFFSSSSSSFDLGTQDDEKRNSKKSFEIGKTVPPEVQTELRCSNCKVKGCIRYKGVAGKKDHPTYQYVCSKQFVGVDIKGKKAPGCGKSFSKFSDLSNMAAVAGFKLTTNKEIKQDLKETEEILESCSETEPMPMEDYQEEELNLQEFMYHMKTEMQELKKIVFELQRKLEEKERELKQKDEIIYNLKKNMKPPSATENEKEKKTQHFSWAEVSKISENETVSIGFSLVDKPNSVEGRLKRQALLSLNKDLRREVGDIRRKRAEEITPIYLINTQREAYGKYRKNLQLVGVNTRNILDISFIGGSVAELLTTTTNKETLTQELKRAKLNVSQNFNPLNPGIMKKTPASGEETRQTGVDAREKTIKRLHMMETRTRVPEVRHYIKAKLLDLEQETTMPNEIEMIDPMTNITSQ